jgi:uncharacterized membrane protein
VALGAKVASFVGIAAVIVAVAFFVGYAIQHNWIGPGARILMGLATGAALVAAGHAFDRRGEAHRTLARALTGGGSALFYFAVFAAYGVYHLVGSVTAGIGLATSAAGVIALSVVYDSQAVALLGVIGSFVTPLLISSDFEGGLFPLIYVAVIDIPVMWLGVRRDWKTLCNLAFIFTVFYAALWLGGELPAGWRSGLLFVLLYHAQFVALSFMQIRRQRAQGVLSLDLVRLSASASLLGVAVYFILGEAGRESWRGAAFGALAAAHAVLALAAAGRADGLRKEALAFAAIAVGFAGFALPVQLDGAWVSLGWSIEGAALAWLALRARSPLLQVAAAGLGLLGPIKSLAFDHSLFATPPEPFLNSRFAVGMLCALLLAIQARLHRRHRPDDDGEVRMSEFVACMSVFGFVAAAFADAYWTMSPRLPWTGLWTTAVLLAAGAVAVGLGRGAPALGAVGFCLLVAVPLKILGADLDAFGHRHPAGTPPFQNSLLWLRLLLPLAGAAWYGRRGTARNAAWLYALALATVIALVTVETGRLRSPWRGSLITMFWAVAAMAMTVSGLVRRRTWLRYMGLVLFGLTVVKVFVVDLADLRGLQRIAAFLAVGLLLLALSFIYQRVAPILMGARDASRAPP